MANINPESIEGLTESQLPLRIKGDAWQEFSHCIGEDLDMFMPERGASTDAAKAICAKCVVREECLEYSIVNKEQFGIWGGLDERERRKIIKLGDLSQN